MNENVVKLGDVSVRPLYFGGHALYVRKCKPGEKFGDDFNTRQIGGIILPTRRMDPEHPVDDLSDWSQYVELLAKGPRVGTKCSKAHAKRYGRARRINMNAQIGDILYCPNDHENGIQKSPIVDFEFFIEESIPLAIWRNTDG